ncbi:hypothetical protein C0991_001275 [Blastosporella zonata]|nr:hypothetical protein C0991_001275 [Blastosporella zonata]
MGIIKIAKVNFSFFSPSGNCWRSLPLDEKKVWEVKAKHAKAEHKARYPEYRFKPVHNKNKDKKKEKAATTVEDERRCEEVAQLLLEGKKGDELAAAVRNLDLMRTESQTPPVFHLRRSSSVPLPNDYYPYFNPIALPNAPFFSSRPPSPLDPMARQQQRMMLGNRRASSARPAMVHRSWTLPMEGSSMHQLQRDDSPLPEVDTSLFNPSFFGDNSNFFSFNDNQLFMNPLGSAHEQNAFGPLDNVSPHDIITNHHQQMYNNGSASSSLPELDPMSWIDPQLQPPSHPSTAYSGSPASSDAVLPVPAVSILHAPQPQSAAATVTSLDSIDMWKDYDGGSFTSDPAHHQHFSIDGGFGLDFDPVREQEVDLSSGFDPTGMGCSQGLNSLFQPGMFDENFAGDYHDLGYA